MSKNRIFEEYKDPLSKEFRDYHDFHHLRKIVFDAALVTIIFKGPLENSPEANIIIDKIETELKKMEDNMRSDGERMSEMDMEDYIFDYEPELGSLGYSVDYESLNPPY